MSERNWAPSELELVPLALPMHKVKFIANAVYVMAIQAIGRKDETASKEWLALYRELSATWPSPPEFADNH